MGRKNEDYIEVYLEEELENWFQAAWEEDRFHRQKVFGGPVKDAGAVGE